MKTKTFKFCTSARFIFWLTFGLLLLFAFIPRGKAQALEAETFPYKKKFIISSYYTPLPNQSLYVTGTYEGDIRLNGEGMHSADGTLVYPGMAAADKRFPFGTKMEIPGFGMVAIHDRGGAIKGDRLDIWVGRGEEGLRRAYGWGLRTLEVTVYGIDTHLRESVNIEALPLADIRILTKTKHFLFDLAIGDEGTRVKELQLFLKKLGYFNGEISGSFDEEIRAALEKFQLTEKIIDSTADPGAGNFGPKTRVSFETALEREIQSRFENIPTMLLKAGERGSAVQKLQGLLQRYGYLQEINERFDQSTKQALIRFQLDHGVIEKENAVGAGFYGKRTRETFLELITHEFTPLTLFTKNRELHQTAAAQKKLFSTSLGLRDHGPEVILLQEELQRLHFLGLTSTGHFGKNTEHAVKKFQEAFAIVKGTEEDGAGVVGPQTLAKLNELAMARLGKREHIAHRKKEQKIVATAVSQQTSGTLLASSPLTQAVGASVFPKEPQENHKETIKNLENEPVRESLPPVHIPLIVKQSNGVISLEQKPSLVESKITSERVSGNSLSGSRPMAEVISPIAIFTLDLKFRDRGKQVEGLQKELMRLHFLARQPTGFFGYTTKHAVKKFQQAFHIDLPPGEHYGLFGFKTREKLNELIQNRQLSERLIVEVTERRRRFAKYLKEERTKLKDQFVAFGMDLSYGSRGPAVEVLQKVLRELGFFPGRLSTQYFGDVTKRSLIAFQKTHGLIESGDMDEKTRKLLNKITEGS